MKTKLIIFVAILLVGVTFFLYQRLSKNTTTLKTNTSTTTETISGTTTPTTSYSMAEVAKHNSESDCWLVIDNAVYDVTKFIPDHPGGKEILKGCGKDATSLFMGEREHQEENAASYLPTYKIGTLQGS